MPLFGALAESKSALKPSLLKKQIFSIDYRYFWGLYTGIKPAVVYRIDLVFVKQKSLAKCPVTVQSGQKIYAKIRK
jgi:hypothetical protein